MATKLARAAQGWLGRQTGQAGLLWLVTLGTALLLALVGWVERRGFPLTELPKGSVAAYTQRAEQDAVYDLHETFRVEAAEAKQSYLPIYNRDDTLPFSHQEPIVLAALAESLELWRFPEEPAAVLDAGAEGGGPADLAAPDSQQLRAPRAGRRATPVGAIPRPPGPSDLGPGDAGREAGSSDGGGFQLSAPLAGERRQEIQALIQGYFRLLETYYRDGVVGDSEFPQEKKNVRVYYQDEYNIKQVSSLHRFSELQPALERRGAEIFIRTDPRVQKQVINFILQRLPPNLSYSRENEKFIGDISQVTGVKMVLIRSGDVLVQRGQVVDTRAFYALRASARAAAETSRFWQGLSNSGLLFALMALFLVASREITPAPFRTLRPYLLIYGGTLLLVIGGLALLLSFPLHPAVVPQAAIALAIAVVLGRSPALLVAALVPSVLVVINSFDLASLLVGLAGGFSAALLVVRRRRFSAVAAGVMVGLVQALAFQAARVIEGRPQTYEELWASGQAFVGGLLAGGLAMLMLPFAERLLGKSSRGKLRVLTDFDHPLARELRERAPGTFAHTVNLINMVEPAVEAIGRDRLLARAGTLFHDVGKIASPQAFVENQRPEKGVAAGSAAQQARAIIDHVANGLQIARQHRLTPDVTAFIAEHHGTAVLEQLHQQAQTAGEGAVDPALFRFPGPKPQSVETAVLLLADAVETRFRAADLADAAAVEELVDQVILTKLGEFQFDECGITQGQLKRIRHSFVDYLQRMLRKQASASFF